jgi:SAM-dependent methyltransferase
MPVSDFISVPETDRNVLDEIQIPPNGRVADLGCGIGRHLAYVRHRYPTVECCGVDFCDLQRDFAENNFLAPKHFVANIGDLQGDFDAVFMLGNGLGVLGDENGIINGLRHWGQRIKPGGYFVIESSSRFNRDFDPVYASTSYQGQSDPFFPWYGASSNCLKQLLETPQEDGTCFKVSLKPASYPDPFYIAIAKKC